MKVYWYKSFKTVLLKIRVTRVCPLIFVSMLRDKNTTHVEEIRTEGLAVLPENNNHFDDFNLAGWII